MAPDKRIERLKQQDRSALEELYKSYGGALLRVISGTVTKREEAEEVLQDTFVKIWRSIDQFDPQRGRFFTWAVQIARRTALDKVKTKKHQRNATQESIDAHPNSDQFGQVVSSIEDVGLRRVIASMKESRRRVVDCFYFKNYTQKETSEYLEMPLGTVKTELRNAVIELRNLLAKEFKQ